MLHEFITGQRDEIIALCRSKIASRRASTEAERELENGVPLFLDELADTLRFRLGSSVAMESHATRNGSDLMGMGITVAQVVHTYGDVCQAITEHAVELNATITTDEFRTLNRCLDDAIADSVTEYERQHDQFLADANAERQGVFSHELGTLLNSAVLAFEALRSGSVGVGGSTGAILARSLKGMCTLVDLSRVDVRLDAEIASDEVIPLRGFIEEIEMSAALEAKARGLDLAIGPVANGLAFKADRQILASVVANLLHNAFKFTKAHGTVTLRVRSTDERIVIEVEDECGGLADGEADQLFEPFVQRGTDRSGLGLGLAICLRGVHAHGGSMQVRDMPGKGCVFVVDMPRELVASW